MARILHIMASLGEVSAPYNEHVLPLCAERDMAVCSYFNSTLKVPVTMKIFEGKGSLSVFFRSMREAFASDGYDVVHVHSTHVGFLFLVFCLFSARARRSPRVFTVHTSLSNLRLKHIVMFIPIMSFFDAVVFCSESSRNSFPAWICSMAGGRFRTVCNGVDIDRVNKVLTVVGNKGEDEGGFRIAAVGFSKKSKNVEVLLRAFKISSGAGGRLLLVGGAPRGESFLECIKELGLDAGVELTGSVKREQVFELLSTADLFVSTSKVEGMPVSVLEAMACGCPVILSDIPPHREIVGDADFIPLVPPDDIDGFSREIIKVRNMPPFERSRLGDRCRKLVEEKFPLGSMQEGYDMVYSEVIR